MTGCEAETIIESISQIPQRCQLRKNHKGKHKVTFSLEWGWNDYNLEKEQSEEPKKAKEE